MRFRQQYTRDIDAIWEDAAAGGMSQYEDAASFYGIESDGLAHSISDRRVRREVLSDAHFADIVDGRPTTIKEESNAFTMSSADMQKLLLLNGAPDDARLKDGLWGPFSHGTAVGVGRALGFNNVNTGGINFGTLPNGKRGHRSVRVSPKTFVSTLINRAASRPGDVVAADCQKFPPNALRATVRVLGSSQVNATGGHDSVLEGAFRKQAENAGLKVSVFRPANDGNIVVCPGSTAETLFKKAAEMLNCVQVSAANVNRALVALGYRDLGVIKPGKPSKPLDTALKNVSTRVSTASLTRLRNEGQKRCAKVVSIRFTPSGAGFTTESVLVCPPECWTKISNDANEAIKKAERAQQRRIDKNYTKFIPVKNVQTLMRQCSSVARKDGALKQEWSKGIWGSATSRHFSRIMKNRKFPKVAVILDKKKKNVRIKPKAAWDDLKKCAADAEARRERQRRRREAERKKREDLVKPDGQPMEPETTPIPADTTADVTQDEPDPGDSPGDDPSTGPLTPEEPTTTEAGIGGAPALLAGLAAIALILFASQQRG